jgi:hypothetical protein
MSFPMMMNAYLMAFAMMIWRCEDGSDGTKGDGCYGERHNDFFHGLEYLRKMGEAILTVGVIVLKHAIRRMA